MRQTKETGVTGGSVSYQVSSGEIHVMECRVEEALFAVPGEVEQMPVTVIGKKAILGNKLLRELYLPDTVREIGDWAFAHCGNLKQVMLPRKNISFGKGVFKDCKALQGIGFNGEERGCTEQLLAATPVMLEAEYLLAPMEAGEKAWFEKLDARLMTLLNKPDEEGYSRQVLCGEEDLMASLELYLQERQREKARLCYLRLLNDRELEDGFRRFMEEYLKSHSKGCESEASWEVVFQERGNEQRYYQCFAQAGCITSENFDGLLQDMGDSYPEMKAYLLRYREEKLSQNETDFFTGLSLD